MTPANRLLKSEVGEVRPSQTITTFGVGTIVDLPNLSVLVMGLDDWSHTHSDGITEERLLLSAQSILGPQVARFLTPPRRPDAYLPAAAWFDEALQIGVPVAPFPRWMVCSRAQCRLLAPISSGLFEAKAFPYRPDKACYIHNCNPQGRSPLVLPARFTVTCEHGHLDDFPWWNSCMVVQPTVRACCGSMNSESAAKHSMSKSSAMGAAPGGASGKRLVLTIAPRCQPVADGGRTFAILIPKGVIRIMLSRCSKALRTCGFPF